MHKYLINMKGRPVYMPIQAIMQSANHVAADKG